MMMMMPGQIVVLGVVWIQLIFFFHGESGVVSASEPSPRFPIVTNSRIPLMLKSKNHQNTLKSEQPEPNLSDNVEIIGSSSRDARNSRVKIPDVLLLKKVPDPESSDVVDETKPKTKCHEDSSVSALSSRDVKVVGPRESVMKNIVNIDDEVNYNIVPSSTTSSTMASTSGYTSGYTTSTGGGSGGTGGGIYGYTSHTPTPTTPTTPSYFYNKPSVTYNNKPSVNYYRPPTKPPVDYRPPTTTPIPPPAFMTSRTTTTFRPRPPPTVIVPPVTSTSSSSSGGGGGGSTIVPIIGVEGDDDDDDELVKTTDSTFNTEGDVEGGGAGGSGGSVGVGRSLFSGLSNINNRLNKSPGRQIVPGNSRRVGAPGGMGAAGAPGAGINGRLQSSRGLKFAEDSNVVTEFVFSDIKCSRTKNKEYFGASIHMKSGFHLPYIRDRPQDPLTSSQCRMEPLDVPNAYHITVMDLRGCGVEQCGDSFCLTMVFPRVPTLALADDEVTTIKCLPQKSSISETRTISFAGDNLEIRRSSSTVEGGGQDFAAEVGVFRQNPGANNGLFVKRVNSGGVVQLGEPLQLRSVVRGGDGWAHSKLTDVKVWRMRDSYPVNLEKLNPSDASEVITLVDGSGCRNSEYEVIAESHPLRDPRNNLVHHFTFKAFLFRGQRANEPLIVTAKVMACQEAGECKATECSSALIRNLDPNVKRYKRSPDPVEHHNASSIVHDFSSQLALRVVGLQDHSASLTEEDLDGGGRLNSDPYPPATSFSCAEKMAFSAAGGGAITIFVCGLALSLIFYTLKYRKDSEDGATNSGNAESCKSSSNKMGTMNSRVYGHVQHQQQKPQLPRKSQHKPLPPPPKDYAIDISHDQLANNNNNNNFPSSSINGDRKETLRLDSDVAKIIQQLSSANKNSDGRSSSRSRSKSRGSGGGSVGGEMSEEYECIDEVRGGGGGQSSKGKEGDGVYIVYCYNNDKKKRSVRPTSAPPSLRERKRNHHMRRAIEAASELGGGGGGGGDTEESEESYSTTEKSFPASSRPLPRTVRSVKRNHHHHQQQQQQNSQKSRGGTGIRRRLSSIYREVYANRCRSGSFPARISAKHSSGGNRRNNKISSRGGGGGGSRENSDTYSASDFDSAYCGSTCDGTRSSSNNEDHRSNSSSSKFRRTFCRQAVKNTFNGVTPTPTKVETSGGGGSDGGYANLVNSPCEPLTVLDHGIQSSPPTHFVTRNDSSTQIIIYPETDV